MRTKIQEMMFEEFKRNFLRRNPKDTLFYAASYSACSGGAAPIKDVYEFILEIKGKDEKIEAALLKYNKDSK